jgi:prepilin-type N-terminal cleavage/methylation domain-containing protein/prepilin-type processing-associated H-X9-DG protein
MVVATHKPAHRTGFTLVELLVVVAVIALLIGVLLPALAGARKSSQKVTSSANLRQLAIYKNLYAEDFKDWYPMVVVTQGGIGTGNKNRYLSAEDLAKNQYGYGGYAGFFSLNQKNATKSQAIWKRDYTAVWNGVSWVNSEEGKVKAVMDRYMEGPGSYGTLQNPADTSDGGENGNRYPLITTEKILDEYNVAWYNISYFYIAGMKRTDPSLCLLGDETNHVDIGTANVSTISGVNPYYGTFRRIHPDTSKRGLQDVDNHGKSGGNYAYSDGHVEWIVGRTNPNTDSVEPHDRIFGEITTFLKKRGDSTSAVQTVD